MTPIGPIQWWRKFRRTGHRNVYLFSIIGYFGLVVLIAAANPFPLQALRLISFDSYQRLAPRAYDDGLPVRVVDIDDASLRTYGQWPWPRTLMADLIGKLHDAGAATVALDFMFPERDRSSLEEVIKTLPPQDAEAVASRLNGHRSNDAVFAKAIADARAVLGITLTNAPEGTLVSAKAGFAVAGDSPNDFLAAYKSSLGNLPELNMAAVGLGALNWIPDRDQVVRRVPLVFRVGEQIVPSLAAETLRVAQGASSYLLKASNANGETAFGNATGLNHIRIGQFEVPTDADGGVWLHFRASRPDRYLSAAAVLQGKVDPDEVNGRLVLIGTSAPGLADLRATPLDASIAGVEVHAQILEHILSNTFLSRPDYAPALEIAIVLFAGTVLAIFLPRMSASLAAVTGAGVVILFFGGAWTAYRNGLLFDAVYPSLVIFVLVIGSTLYSYWMTEQRRGEVQRMFGQYVAPAVVKELVANPDKMVLGGEERELTLMFSDVRSFSSISEKLTAVELTRFLNELLTPVTDLVTDCHGTIDKYMGDGIMAFWNAPLDDTDHAAHACRAAIAIQKALPDLNRKWSEDAERGGRPFHPVNLGIGLNTGTCCVGNLGSSRRFDYSAIGDEVNVTSRYEGLTKFYGLPTLVGEKTIAKAGDVPALEVDLVRVVGRAGASRIYTLAEALGTGEDVISALAPHHAAMLDAYRKRDWTAATAALEKCRSFGIARLEHLYDIYGERIVHLRTENLPADWDGVYTARQK